ncbi:hypothetical protein [Chitinimonas sp. BJYL2]|uniref:hypothetical protein n=1 Tax=Chitinimonas sp. BJYL2 TaxID=2976696 RepID=UPI0022B4A0CD|nr:hypothetical protein [Chitinimonas sp. BJYL2]
MKVLSACLVLSLSPAVTAENTLTWAVSHLPPIYIQEGRPELLGTGIGDQLLDALAEHMPGYRHVRQKMNLPRLVAEWQAGKPVCFASGIRTPERDALTVSTPSAISPGPMLVIRRADRARFGELPVDLATLMTRKDLQGAYQRGVAYSPDIAALLEQTDEQGPFKPSVVNETNLIRMLELRRIDYTLGRPQVLRWLEREGTISPALESLPLRQSQQMSVAYVLCTRNEWGRKTIRDIDAALQRMAASPIYPALFQAWLPEQEWKRSQPDIQRFLSQRRTPQVHDPDDTLPDPAKRAQDTK